MFFLRRLGPPVHKITHFEVSLPDLPFVVHAKSLLVVSGANDGRLVGLLEQVDCVLLSLTAQLWLKAFTLGVPWSRSEGSTALAP